VQTLYRPFHTDEAVSISTIACAGSHHTRPSPPPHQKSGPYQAKTRPETLPGACSRPAYVHSQQSCLPTGWIAHSKCVRHQSNPCDQNGLGTPRTTAKATLRIDLLITGIEDTARITAKLEPQQTETNNRGRPTVLSGSPGAAQLIRNRVVKRLGANLSSRIF